MEKKTITVWERHTKSNDGSWKWEHNHISDGFDDSQQEPTPVSEDQGRLWKGSEWRKKKAFLVNGKVEIVE